MVRCVGSRLAAELYPRRVTTLVTCMALLGGVSACSAETPSRGAPATLEAAVAAPVTPPPAAQSASISREAFAGLRWIAGSWRGSGDGQAPFYERYRFEDDSTLVVETFTDSTLAVVESA